MTIENPAVDLFMTTPTIAPDAGNAIFKGIAEGCKNLDALTMEILECAGKFAQAGVTFAGAKVMDGVAKVGSIAASAQVPFTPGFTPSLSSGRESDPSPSHGLGKVKTLAMEPSLEANLGTMSPPLTNIGQARSYGGMGMSV